MISMNIFRFFAVWQHHVKRSILWKDHPTNDLTLFQEEKHRSQLEKGKSFVFVSGFVFQYLTQNEKHQRKTKKEHGNFCLWRRIWCKYLRKWLCHWDRTISWRNGVLSMTQQQFCCCWFYSLLLFRSVY